MNLPTTNRAARVRRAKWKRAQNDGALYVMLIAPVLIVLVFRYFPIGGAMIAFKDYDLMAGILRSDWVGLRWFEKFLTNRKFATIFWNTVGLSITSLLFSFPFPILLALSLNEVRIRWFKRAVQTASYLPYFISTVVVVGMMNQILSPTTGIVNIAVSALGGPTINYVAEPRWFRTMYIGSGIWSTMGYNSILYIAALTAISPELYEAVAIDGGNRWAKIVHVTLPGILPTILVLFLMSLGTLINVGYEKAFLMQNDLNLSASEILGTYVYKQGLVKLNYDYAAAVGLFQSAINMVLVVSANKLSRSVAQISLW